MPVLALYATEFRAVVADDAPAASSVCYEKVEFPHDTSYRKRSIGDEPQALSREVIEDDERVEEPNVDALDVGPAERPGQVRCLRHSHCVCVLRDCL
jgi:hypothetical protein